MATDWKLIRNLMNTVLDCCEDVEKLQIKEEEWAVTTPIGDQEVSVYDLLQSAWRYPENLKDCLIRARHEMGQDRHFLPDIHRSLVKSCEIAAELIGLEKPDTTVSQVDPYRPERKTSAREMVEELTEFYRDHITEGLHRALERKPKRKSAPSRRK